MHFLKAPITLHHQADAMLNQAAPVQNTWYPVLASQSRSTRIYLVSVSVAVADETLQVRILVDGVTISGTINATAATAYRADLNYGILAESLSLGATQNGTYLVEGRNVSVDVRKTTALGAGALTAKVVHALRY